MRGRLAGGGQQPCPRVISSVGGAITPDGHAADLRQQQHTGRVVLGEGPPEQQEICLALNDDSSLFLLDGLDRGLHVFGRQPPTIYGFIGTR